MRFFASIFFLSILLFNWFGYELVMNYADQQQTAQLELQLDNKEYDAATLVEIRVPVTLPYQTDWKEFERVDGEIEFNGMHYKYVERKLEAGEMIYKCIPDKNKKQLVNARENFFKLVNDLQSQSQEKETNSQQQHSYKTFSFDYCEKLNNWNFHSMQLQSASRFMHSTQSLLTMVIPAPVQPPDA